jgi:large subunit ribosomal protein L20
MPRVKGGVNAHKRHKKVLKLAKGYRGSKSKLYRVANEQVMKSGNYAYIHRRLKKRDFRKLWIARINAAARNNGTTYSRMVHGLKVAGVDINRKVLAELAITDPGGFTELAELSKKHCSK